MLTRRTVLIGAAALPTLAVCAIPARAATVTLKLALDLVDTHPGTLRSRQAADAIRTETDGRVELRVFPNSQLGTAGEMLNQIRSGAVDLFPAAAAGLSALVPVAGISSMGFAFSTYDQVWAAMDGKLGALIRRDIAKTQTIMALDSMWDNGFRQITNSVRPITEASDLQGIKLRVPVAPLYTSMFKALGAAPTSLGIAELYTSLQTKLADGEENPLPIIDLYKFYEVQKYCSLTNHMWDGFWMLANQRSWNRVPADLQPVVIHHLNDAAKLMRADVVQLNEGVLDRLSKTSLTINKVAATDSFRTVLTKAGFYSDWRKLYGEEAWSALESYTGPLT